MAKGIAILLVILGHSIGGIGRGLIFSFHMPLFFIMSSITFRLSTDNNEFINNTEKSFKRLFLPAIIIYCITTTIQIIIDVPILTQYSSHEIRLYLAQIVNVFIFGSGFEVSVENAQIAPIGIPWFLIVLFLGKTLFDYLHLKLNRVAFFISIALCYFLGSILGIIQWLPFSCDIVLAIQPLLLFGIYFRNEKYKHIPPKMICSLLIWLGLFAIILFGCGTYLEFACRTYPLFPLCYICAISGTLFISYLCQLISRINIITIPLIYLGKNTMVILWVHCIEDAFPFVWQLTSNNIFNAIIRMAEDIFIFIIIMQLKRLIFIRQSLSQKINL